MNIFERPPKSIAEIRSLWKGCDLCVFASLWKETGPCLPVEDIIGKEILVVGQWPGEKDMEIGTPFSGKQGLIAISIMEKAGFQRDNLFFTNVLLCSCPTVPNKLILQNCREQIDQTLSVLKPIIVIALGSHAAKRFGASGSMKNLRGKTVSYKSYKVSICTHPASIARAKDRAEQKKVETEVLSDLRQAKILFDQTKNKISRM